MEKYDFKNKTDAEIGVKSCVSYRSHWKQRKNGAKLYILGLAYVTFVVCNVLSRVYNELIKYERADDHELSVRIKRDADSLQEINGTLFNGTVLGEDENTNCTPRSAEEFPGNFLTFEETRDGGVFVHILIVLYVFGALAIVCDDYFCASLEIICDELSLQEDVAGATFMAAGSSAPEFFTALIGAFIAKSDVGVGTIVGSAVFNILFIVGVCGLFAGMLYGGVQFLLVEERTRLQCTWEETTDIPQVHWQTFSHNVRITCICEGDFVLIANMSVDGDKYVLGNCLCKIVKLTWYPVLRDSLFYLLSVAALIIVIQDNEVQWYEGLILVLMYVIYIVLMYFNKSIEPFIEGVVGKLRDKKHCKKRHEDHNSNQTESAKPLYYESNKNSLQSSPTPDDDETTFSVQKDEDDSDDKSGDDESECHPPEGHKDSKEYESPWQIPDTLLKRIFWVAMIPMHALFFITIPDCRRPGHWHKTYAITFIMSIVWIAGLSYIMVWMVTVAGDALGIPETVMGLTLLAAGTSVPDMLSSLFVARDGLGDMAVSNSIGSNVFDILMCLGLPWLVKSLAFEDGEAITIYSDGLTYSAITLLSTVVFLLIALIVTRWRLDKKFGALCLIVYVIVITFSCLYELNIFGDFNVKTYCPRKE